jgi:hypothetical protein
VVWIEKATMRNIPLILTFAVVLFACNTKSGSEADHKEEDNIANYADAYVATDEASEAEADLSGGYAPSSFSESEDYDFDAGEGDAKLDKITLHLNDESTNNSSQVTSVATRSTSSARTKSNTVKVSQSYSDKIIRTADIGLELEDYLAGKKKILAAAKKYGAYIADENEKSNFSRITNRITLKIKADQFEGFMGALDGDFTNFDYKRITTQDVGEEYYDLQARLKTKKEMEIRYMGFLKKAKSIKDLLRIEEQIRKLREEIEAKEGRLRYLSSRVSFSTIHLNIYQNLDFDQPTKIKAGFGSKMLAGLKSGWNSILKLIIGVSYGWPYLLFFGFAGYFAIKWLRRKKL